MTNETGTEVIESRPRSLPQLGVMVVSALLLGVGLGVGLAWSWAAQRPPRTPGVDGGAVYVCGGHALATLHAHDLAGDPVQVMLPLRGDAVLLPVTRGGVDMLVGSITGHQELRPSGGHLALTQRIAVPAGDEVAAQVGPRTLALTVTRCPGR